MRGVRLTTFEIHGVGIFRVLSIRREPAAIDPRASRTRTQRVVLPLGTRPGTAELSTYIHQVAPHVETAEDEWFW